MPRQPILRVATPPAIRLTAGATEVAFLREGDRWRHLVTVAGVSVLESVEGVLTPEDDPRWPASPVLTEVSRVAASGRPVLLGLGLAGRSHFSLSCTAHPDLPDTLLFEVACRIQARPPWLGSTYRATDGGLVRAAPAGAGGPPPCTVQWAYAVGPTGLVAPPPAAGPRHP